MKNSYSFYMDKLKDEYKETFEKIELYSMVCKNQRQEDDREEILMQILDMILAAQQDKVPVNHVIGEDLETFCEQVFSQETRNHVFYDFMNSIKRVMFVYFIFTSISLWFKILDGQGWRCMDESIVVVIVSFGVTYLILDGIIRFFRKRVFRYKKMNGSKLAIILLLSMIIVIPLSVYVNDFIHVEIPEWSIVLVSGGYLFAFYTIQFYQKRVHNKEKEKVTKRETVHFSDLVSIDIPVDIVKGYYKKNEIREKKGKKPIPEDEFMRKFRKEGAPWKLKLFKVLTEIITWLMMLSLGWNSIYLVITKFSIDALTDVGISVFFAVLLYKYNHWIAKICSTRMKIAQQCIKENITLFQLVEQMQENKLEE